MRSTIYPVLRDEAEEFAQELGCQAVLKNVLLEDLISLARVGLVIQMPSGMSYSEVAGELSGSVTLKQNAPIFLLEGALDLWLLSPESNHVHLRYLGAPCYVTTVQWLGEGQPENHSVVAREDAKLFVISSEAFGFLTDKYPRVALNMLHEYQKWICEIGSILLSGTSYAPPIPYPGDFGPLGPSEN